jgi:bifunctional NMN adenylyltransferase/nudix hydrolase
MYNKPYDTALLVGRFSILHKGHQSLIDTALLLCDRVLVFVGSAQESGTLRNPFDVATRIEMIKAVYPNDQVIVRPLTDLTNENDITADWGKFVLENTKGHIYKTPEVMIYGNDESRSRWFDMNDIKGVTEVIINRSKLPISATQMREAMVKDNKELWFECHDQKLHKYYDRLRGQLMACKPYREMFNNMLKPKELKGWTDYGR